jgi:hypothetical protein
VLRAKIDRKSSGHMATPPFWIKSVILTSCFVPPIPGDRVMIIV